ncbi:MAG: hypothetical protein JXR46_00755 [Calditrichaceae bacterium]|nr:hypothetical protein [Calditrichaceae bacterium]MBN2707544.1 hypothetical protein [Calditrichaceae bacterium]RQV95631.1 MAG: hypothetical protein EH224_07160 [Calditrichota bacterium]
MIIAHRGASHDAPENTLAAINLAWLQNADAIEVDIHVTKDQHAVVIHDANTKRTGDKYLEIMDNTLNDLKKIDIGIRMDDHWKGEVIPTLEEVFYTVPVNKSVFVEVKCGRRALLPLRKLIHKNIIKASQIFLMDFDLQNVLAMRNEFPDIPVLWLYEFKADSGSAARKINLNELVKTALKNRISGLSVENVPEFDSGFIQNAKGHGLQLYCWTVNEPDKADYLFEHRIDGIITDRPGWIRNQIKRQAGYSL